MSHLLDFKTCVTDRNALVRALERMGFKNKVEVHDKAVLLSGHMIDTGRKLANVIVRKQYTGIPADLGFEEKVDADGNTTFVAHIDEYNYSGFLEQGMQYNKSWQDKLYTCYNVEKSKMELEAKGIDYTELKDDQGRLQIKATFKKELSPGKLMVHL
jgi:hypothetical protein